MRACLRKIYNAEESVDESDTESLKRRAVHEAGHAAIAEYFPPGSVSFATIHSNRHGINGMVLRKEEDHFHESFKNAEIEIMIALGGKAATELVLNEIDMGTNRDLHSAFRNVERLLDNIAAYDFHSWLHGEETSSNVVDRLDIVKGAEMTRYYSMTKQILGKNYPGTLYFNNKLRITDFLDHTDITVIIAHIRVILKHYYFIVQTEFRTAVHQRFTLRGIKLFLKFLIDF